MPVISSTDFKVTPAEIEQAMKDHRLSQKTERELRQKVRSHQKLAHMRQNRIILEAVQREILRRGLPLIEKGVEP